MPSVRCTHAILIFNVLVSRRRLMLALLSALLLAAESAAAYVPTPSAPWALRRVPHARLVTRAGHFAAVGARPRTGRRSLRSLALMSHGELEADLTTSLDAGRDAHDRAAELYSGTVSERPWGALFTALATSRTFREKLWAKEPFVIDAAAAGTAGSAFLTRSFRMDDVAQFVNQYPSAYAAQGALSPDGKGGWYMKKVGAGQGQDAMMAFADVEESLKQGTVVLNSAGAYLTPLATISLATLEGFQMPVGLNVYLTAPGMTVSAPPHTDKQDVFVLQTQGSKHWRVFAPPAPSNKMAADPYARGKGPDALSLEELGAPLIETNLGPGQLIYIPAGFPHTTDTLEQVSTDPSVHLTVGLDTHIWGLDYATLREL